MTKLKVLDLFSGLGGFSLGLQNSGHFEPAAFAEIDPYCQRVLARHWPKVKIYGDVRLINASVLNRDGIAIRAICGGFPCQDVSSGGAGAGLQGSRSGLWFEYARLIDELRPDLVFVENVAALLGRGLDQVLGFFASIRYDAEWHCVPATALGYPHERDRVWLVAYPSILGRQEGFWHPEGWGRRLWHRLRDRPSSWAIAANDDEVRSRFLRIVDGLPDRVERIGALGNSVIPEQVELIARAVMERTAA